MEQKPKFDFSGFATKIGIKCSDGRTILRDAFKHMDGQKVPLVWHHQHKDPDNILGYAILENRDEGTYAYCQFNNSPKAQSAKEAVKHGDITDMSIFADSLKQKGLSVIHGIIKEVSLVLSGANPGATIENLYFAHGDGVDETEAIITFVGFGGLNGEVIEHAEESSESRLESLRSTVRGLIDSDLPFRSSFDDRSLGIVKAGTTYTANIGGNEMTTSQLDSAKAHLLRYLRDGEASMEHAATYPEDATVQQVFDTFDDTQKTVVYALIANALEEGDIEHSEKEGESVMKTNVFDKSTEKPRTTLTHDQMSSIMKEAESTKATSLKDVFLEHATDYGIENIEILFPDARTLRPTPDTIKRDDGWVSNFLNEVYKTPFARIKSRSADLTADEARAKGYITGNRKIEEVIPVLRRVTTPTTIN